MTAISIDKIPDFNGIETYPAAMQHLLTHGAEIGSVVVRGCFDAQAVDKTSVQVDLREVLPDEDARDGASSVLKSWWKDNGIAGHWVGVPYAHGLRHRNGVSSLPHGEYRTPVEIYSCIKGSLNLFTLAGDSIIDTPTRSYDSEQAGIVSSFSLELEREVRQVPSDSAKRRLFSHMNLLLPGDVALVMGNPVPAYGAIKAARRSEYATHHYASSRMPPKLIYARTKPALTKS